MTRVINELISLFVANICYFSFQTTRTIICPTNVKPKFGGRQLRRRLRWETRFSPEVLPVCKPPRFWPRAAATTATTTKIRWQNRATTTTTSTTTTNWRDFSAAGDDRSQHCRSCAAPGTARGFRSKICGRGRQSSVAEIHRRVAVISRSIDLWRHQFVLPV